MKIRWLMPLMGVALLAGGQAQASHSETLRYDLAAIGAALFSDTNIGGVQFPANGEFPVKATIDDDFGTNVWFVACQSLDGDISCGEPAEPRIEGCASTVDLTVPVPNRPAFSPNFATTVFVSTHPYALPSTANPTDIAGFQARLERALACAGSYAVSGSVTIDFLEELPA